MSDSGNYELEDIVWEVSDNDDHIVPYAGDQKNGYAVDMGCFYRRKELKSAESNADNGTVSVNVSERKEEASFSPVKEYKKTMLEKSLCPHSSNGGSPAFLDGNAERNNLHSVSDEEMPTPCLSSNNVKSADRELCADNPDLGNQAFAAENNVKQYQLNDASHTENDLAFLGNGLRDKGSDDLLFSGWPELENFEDIDNMLRDCDPTFSLDIDNDDDLSWLSSSHMTEGANPFGLNSVTEQEVYGQSDNGMVVDERNNKLEPADGSGATHHIVSHSQMHSHVSPSKQQKSSEGKSNVHSSKSGVSFIHFDTRNEVGEANQFNSQHSFSRENHQQQQESSFQPCLQTQKAMIKAKSEVGETSAIIDSEVRPLSTTSPMELSHASNQIKPTETSRDASFKNFTNSGNKKKGKLHQHRLSRHAEDSNSRVQRVNSARFYANKTIPGGENEGQSKVDNSEIGFQGGLNSSSTIQEGSSTSAVLNKVSIDESSLMQLQHVMGQLDIRTKLCIRDSLYRLARSAAQRHILGSGGGDDEEANGAFLSGTNKCNTGLVDMETDTNPIDRSIAHWLFHRPSDPSAAAAAPIDVVAAKPKIMVKAPNPLTADKSVCEEETHVVKEDTTKLKIESVLQHNFDDLHHELKA